MISFLTMLLNVIFLLGSLFLILLVLIQRGRGGGLAGMLGGVGGSSAFGSRAGDTFTRVTVGVMVGWIVLAMVLVKITAAGARIFPGGNAAATTQNPAVSAPLDVKDKPAADSATKDKSSTPETGSTAPKSTTPTAPTKKKADSEF